MCFTVLPYRRHFANLRLAAATASGIETDQRLAIAQHDSARRRQRDCGLARVGQVRDTVSMVRPR
jgi:hypothetical protein